MRRLVGVTAVVLLLAGCGSDGGSASDELVEGKTFDDRTGEDALVVSVRDNTFGPQYVTVSAGTAITFDNRGRNPHNVVAVDDAFPEVPTDELQPGDSAEVVLEEPGTYAYYCTLHGTEKAGMVGAITVE